MITTIQDRSGRYAQRHRDDQFQTIAQRQRACWLLYLGTARPKHRLLRWIMDEALMGTTPHTGFLIEHRPRLLRLSQQMVDRRARCRVALDLVILTRCIHKVPA